MSSSTNSTPPVPSPPATSRFGLELRAVLRLAWPVIVVNLGMVSLGVVDARTAGQVSDQALAAVTAGHAFGSAIALIGVGIIFGLDPLVAQAAGAGERERVGEHIQRAFVVAFVLAIPTGLLMWQAESFLRLFRQPPEIIPDAARYIRIVSFGNAAYFLFYALRLTLQALERPLVVVPAIIVANVFNFVANQVLVFGKFGVPALGTQGTAIATLSSRWLMLVGVFWFARRALSEYGVPWRRATHHVRHYLNLLRVGIPVGVQISLEIWVFSCVALLVGAWGVREMAGHGIAISVVSLLFMVPLGIGMASAARVGRAVGRHDMEAARLATRVTLAAGTGFQLLVATGLWLFPRAIGRFYIDDPEVLDIVAVLLPIAAAFQLFDGAQTIGCGVLRGVGDTRVPALIAFVGYWVVGLPSGLLLVHWRITAFDGYWWGLTIGLGLVSILVWRRIRRRLRGDVVRI